ncbi:unnamed protein product, partial [Phyllotreta striolata]
DLILNTNVKPKGDISATTSRFIQNVCPKDICETCIRLLKFENLSSEEFDVCSMYWNFA